MTREANTEERSSVRSGDHLISLRIGEERLHPLDAVGADGGLAFGAGHPVDEGLAHLRLDVRVAHRIEVIEAGRRW